VSGYIERTNAPTQTKPALAATGFQDNRKYVTIVARDDLNVK